MAPLPASLRPLILDVLSKTDLSSVTPGSIRADLAGIQRAQAYAPPADTSRYIPGDFDLEAHRKEIKNLIKECYDQVAGSADAAASQQHQHQQQQGSSSSSNGSGGRVDVAQGQRKPTVTNGVASSSSSSSSPSKPKSATATNGSSTLSSTSLVGQAASASPSQSPSTFAAGGLALPGLGGVRGSHAAPAPAPAPRTTPSNNTVKSEAPSEKAKTSSDADADAKLAAKLQAEWSRSTPSTRGNNNGSSSSSASTKKRKKPAKSRDDIDSDEDSSLDDDDDDDAAPSKSKSKSKSTSSKPKKPRAVNPNNAFNRPLLLSAPMASICNATELPRHGVVKALWAYIKSNDLQNDKNRRQILCDERLKELFGKSVVDSFEMAKLISKHVYKKEDVVQASAQSGDLKAVGEGE